MKLKITSPQNQDKAAQVYQSRLQRLQNALSKAGLDACLIEHPLDLFYFTGLKLSLGKLLIDAGQSLLLVDGRYLQVAKEKSPCFCSLDSPDQWLSFCERESVKRLGFDGRHTSYDRFLQLEQLRKKANQELNLVPASAFFKSIRVVKDAEEISKMQKSADLLWKGFEYLKSALKIGVTEKGLARLFEIYCLENGAEGLSFEPIIAFGPGGAMPHYRAQDTVLKEGDAVLIDIGVVRDGYHSDMTRVLFFKKEDLYLSKLYEIVKRAQRSALEMCRPGQTFGQLDLAARKVFKEEGVEELFVHSLGHGIGLDVHEFPRIKWDGDDKDVVLEAGMVFTVEPGLYVPGTGGVRYEDTIVITEDGYQNFYPAGSKY